MRKVNWTGQKLKLWIATTTTGQKRTYATTARRAKAKMERHGLGVKNVRAGTEKDYLENIVA